MSGEWQQRMRTSGWPSAVLLSVLATPGVHAAPSGEAVADRDRAAAYAVLRRHMATPRLGELWYRRGGQTLCGLVRTTSGSDDADWRMFLIVLKSGRSLVEPPADAERGDKRLVLEKLRVLSAECD